MHCGDAVGYVASGLVLAAFAMKDIVRLRVVAICSNIVFLAYGLSLGLAPVWILHAVLLPMNMLRLAEVLGFNPQIGSFEWVRSRLAGHGRAAGGRPGSWAAANESLSRPG